MDPIEELRAIEEIKALKARYWRGVDMKDAGLLRSVFTDDATYELSQATDPKAEPRPPSGEPDGFVRNTLTQLTGVVTVHHGHTPEIGFTSPTTATGIWPMEDILWVEDEASPLPFRKLHGWGHYHETYRKEAGGWRIATLRLTRIRVETH